MPPSTLKQGEARRSKAKQGEAKQQKEITKTIRSIKSFFCVETG
jgi:hypothetical protein